MRSRTRKTVAVFFLVLMLCQNFIPLTALALTSGPAQPEMQKFTPAGANDLVDLFTGDFKYNIPLMDVGGYPVNLSYNSGSGIDDEASWVGMGWTLNPGVMNRTMRGLPDDFNGDYIEKHNYRKEFRKVGGQLVLKPSIFAWEFGSASIKFGVYKDNYYGIGGSFGASLKFNASQAGNGPLTAGLTIDANSDVRSGVSIQPSLSISTGTAEHDDKNPPGTSASFHYNTRSGLKSFSLSQSFSPTKLALCDFGLSYSKYFGQSYTPTFNGDTENSSFTFSYDGGVSVFGGYLGIGGSGYVYTEKNKSPEVKIPAYGYLNYLNANKDQDVLHDFNREKDGVFLPDAPAIPVPVATHDFFAATSQAGSQQYRPFLNGNFVSYDKKYTNINNPQQAGITAGGGNVFKVGGRIDNSVTNTSTGKWVNSNLYLGVAEAEYENSGLNEEQTYFKRVGEPVQADKDYLELL